MTLVSKSLLPKAPAPIYTLSAFISTNFKELKEKASFPINVTLLGRIRVDIRQPKNAYHQCLTTLSPIVTEVRLHALIECLSPMLVTLSGIVTEVRDAPIECLITNACDAIRDSH